MSHTSELRDYPVGRSFFDMAEKAVLSLRYAIIAQPYLSPDPSPPAEICTERISNSDYVVSIIGFKWGSPVRDDPEISYTEFEFNEAVRLGKPHFVFVIDKKTTRDLPPDAIIDEEYPHKQAAFRQRLFDENHVVGTIDSPENLNAAIYKAIRDYEDRRGVGDTAGEAPVDLPRFADISLLLRQGKVIPFLGEDAGLPPNYEAPGTDPRPGRNELVKRFTGRVPSSLELSLFLADYSQYPAGQRVDLPDVASFYSATSGQPSLVQQRLREAYLVDTEPRAIHRYLANLDTHLLIFVVGFDDLMERALLAAERPFKTIIQPTDRALTQKLIVIDHDGPEPRQLHPQEVDIDLGRESVIYKPHGSFVREPHGWDQYVATEDNNIEVLGALAANSIPDQMYDAILAKQFLFLGLGLDSWTTRSLLSRIKADRSGEAAASRVNQRPAWAVRRNPSMLETKLWMALNADVFDMDLDRFAAGLEESDGAPEHR